MKVNQPLYELIPLGDHEWRFQESPEMFQATGRFDAILESHQGSKQFGRHLKKFLTGQPQHIDGLAHYAMHKTDAGQTLDAYAYAHAAAAVGRSVFPRDFQPGRDRLPGGFVQNRPFLRALNELRLAQAALGDTKAAIRTCQEHMSFDLEDRMGIRMDLPSYLMSEGRDEAALEVFSRPAFADTFHTAEYLHALVLFRMHRLDEAESLLAHCLRYSPQVARFILDPHAERPQDDSPFGITMGCAYEGWFYGQQYVRLWQETKGAVEFLRKAAEPHAAANWARHKTL